jgi:putative ABC transport system permease protein
MPDGRQFNVNKTPVDFGFFEFYGLQPIAGRFFDRRRPGDAVPEGSSSTWSSPVVINETAVRIYGFAGPVQAIGQQVTVGAAPSEIIGVVPDFPIGSIRESVEPTAFYVDPARWSLLSVKLDGAHVTEDLAAIDRIWADNVPDRPARHYFLDAKIEELYRDISREGQLFAAFAAVSFVIGCLGLFGLSAFSAERRTKEIGVRKALGASAFDVAKLMVWQFVKPVAFANLLAWPIAWWLLHHWLDSFAYRIELRPEPFVAAGLLALVIAVLTTAFHAVQAAQSRPVLALRNE